MKKTLILLALLVLVLIGCNSPYNQDKKEGVYKDGLAVTTHCEDNIVCYSYRTTVTKIHCFNDKELADKYC